MIYNLKVLKQGGKKLSEIFPEQAKIKDSSSSSDNVERNKPKEVEKAGDTPQPFVVNETKIRLQNPEEKIEKPEAPEEKPAEQLAEKSVETTPAQKISAPETSKQEIKEEPKSEEKSEEKTK